MSFPSASPQQQPAASLSVKKRKRDDTTNTDTPAEIDSRPFAIRPAGDDLCKKTTYLTPIFILQRAHLPLAALDVQGSGNRLFAAHVQTLEALHENGVEGHIIVAEQKEEGRLYAVERAAKRVYALCRLGQWITKETLSYLAQGQSRGAACAVKRRITAPVSTSPWWSRAAVDLPKERPQDHERPASLLQFKMQPQVPKAIPNLPPNEAGTGAVRQTRDADTQPTTESQKHGTTVADAEAQDPVEELARQYLDALYLSRTSLAYFAKGPLSRARSAITGGVDASTTSSSLIDLLRNSILPVNVMDKKFKDNLPALVKDLPLVTPTQDEKPVKSRRKKKFKPKRDKAGLFTNEHEYLEKWWRGEEVPGSMTSPENTDTALRRRIPGLRSRETYLQVIIILETLYLEATIKPTTPAVEVPSLILDSQAVESQDVDSQAASGTTKRKGKKALDLRSLLETLLDRLCIWQDLDTDAPARNLLSDKDTKHNEPSNDLRDFCIEIIVPFFMSRLPKEAALVNKKLGGPSPPSPEKRKSTSSRSRPGEPATRSRPDKQPRKPLTRVATETLNQATRHIPSLHRSATDSALIKREDSQPTLSSIPPARPQPRPARESALSSYLSGHRQVDLTAKSAAAAERLRKKKETEAQVREAINNARKPNRPMATKEVAARADEKFAQSLHSKSSSRSSRPQHQSQPQHQQQQPGVHVAATPKRASATASAHNHSDNYTYNQPSFIPTSAHSSNPSIIPASSICPSINNLPAHVPQTSHRDRSRTAAAHARGFEETPSRASSSKFTFMSPSASRGFPATAAEEGAMCESPSARRGKNTAAVVGRHVAATPVKIVGRRVDFGVRETPVVGSGGDRKVGPLVEGTPVKASLFGEVFGKRVVVDHDVGDDDDDDGDEVGRDDDGMGSYVGGKSIYDAWNDDYEELS
jgi:DNA replication regulator SLD3